MGKCQIRERNSSSGSFSLVLADADVVCYFSSSTDVPSVHWTLTFIKLGATRIPELDFI
jgi:hypothetical protein